jgi:pyruvate/2-oxoglutarate dehydrogenase complex dihydrolipoamide acyltransferase (E2) component
MKDSDLADVKFDHEVHNFPPIRKGVEDLMWAGRQKNNVHGIAEADVTKARTWFREYKENKGENLSFTAFIIKCIGQAIDENKFMHSVRQGKNKLITFDEVDVSCIIERDHPAIQGKKMPTNYVLRAANKKTFNQISDEIREAQKADLTKGAKAERNNLYAKLPLFIRHLFWRKLLKDPFYRKKMMGTVGLTAIGMFTNGNIGWAIPITPATLTITLGGIYEKPWVIEGKIAIRETLCMTISLDHDIVDGGPATRFIVRLEELIQQGYGLEA